MHKTVGVVLQIIGDADGNTHPECRLQTGIPEFIVDFNITEGQHPHSNGALLIVSDSDEIAIRRDNSDHLTLGTAVISPLDGSGEHPRMKA